MAKRRTPAQIRATKKLVAMNKSRARGNPTGRKWWGPPSPTGYMVYPGGYNHKTIAKAKADAKRISAVDGAARVESAANDKVMARYEWGKLARSNPKKKRKTLLSRFKDSRKLKRGHKATAKWVRAGMPAQRNAGKPPKGFMKCSAVRVVTRGGKKILEVKR